MADTSADDLVVRLQAAIYETEAQTRALYPHLKIVLGLCQSHRDILELHQGEHECREMHEGVYSPDWPADAPYGAPGEKWRHASTEYFETGRPCPTIISLARGYGVEESGDG